MSAKPQSSHPAEVTAPPQEEDAPNARKAIAIAIVTMTVFALGILYVVLVLRFTGTSPRNLGGPMPRQTGQSEIGIVDQPIFENDQRQKRLSQEKRALLTEYGWTDRQAGTIHMPVERAIDEMVREGQP